MRWDLIRTLHCPYSGSRFNATMVVEESASEIVHGIVKTEAGEFPIVEGILRLQVDECRKPMVDFLKAGHPLQALHVALERPSNDWKQAAVMLSQRLAYRFGFQRFGNALNRIFKHRLCSTLLDPSADFIQTANAIGNIQWAHWQIFRFSMPTFLPVFALLPLLKESRHVLDFGSGLGHASFLVSKICPESQITCVDCSFTFLFLAKKYFVSDGDFVCLDADYLLPFDSAYFSHVLSSDALHCIDSKLSVAQEFKRIIPQAGTIVLPHLHNKLSSVQFGKSLTPEGYARLFDGMLVKVIPEAALVRQCFDESELDLKEDWKPTDIDADEGVAVVASFESDVFRQYESIWDSLVDRMTNPAINPVYQVDGKPGHWVLETRRLEGAPSRLAEVLPSTYALQTPSLKAEALAGMKVTNRNTFADLVRQLILMEVPSHYGNST